MEHFGNSQQKSNGAQDSAVSEQQAMSLARILLANYPNGIPADQEGYLVLVQKVLMNYPLELAQKAVLPSGIPAENPTYLPGTGAINNWLAKRAHKYERPYPVFDKLPSPDRKPRPTYEELKKRCWDAGLKIGSKDERTAEMIAAEGKKFREKFNISDEDWDKIPNA